RAGTPRRGCASTPRPAPQVPLRWSPLAVRYAPLPVLTRTGPLPEGRPPPSEPEGHGSPWPAPGTRPRTWRPGAAPLPRRHADQKRPRSRHATPEDREAAASVRITNLVEYVLQEVWQPLR